ncbi:hypothetical protein SAMN04487967_1492 [Natronorubrum sediminis]|uniref:DUF7344 domain-containing protein n=1 Tax=Natronorubrum sediminis TaxID=640943 RepID=A0A1H6FUV7_9EURY|nr:ArsR family transcriptional regulator [Natronorubrum sediminis]SEH14202.1 hypothetical protein SAMN04487967_1492 [Natronorubrum sediminis]
MLPAISDPESLTPITGSSSTDADADNSRSQSLDVLANHRRHYVLHYLEEADESVSLAELADHIAITEHDEDRSAIADYGDALLGTRRRVMLSLRHLHIPKLEAAGAVDFDIDANTVTSGPASESLLARAETVEATTGNEYSNQ